MVCKRTYVQLLYRLGTATDTFVMATPAPTTKQPTKRPEDDKPKETGRGVIKAVNSGDAVVIAKIGVATGGPPPEVELALSLLTAPRLGRRGEPDEVQHASLVHLTTRSTQ